MAARLGRTKATLVTPEQTLAGISISVRNDTATVRLGADVLLARGDVARVVPTGRRSWELHFADETVWTVTDERRPCCGRR